MKIFQRVFISLCSLKLAVLVILAIAVSLATATILESVYDTATAQYWVYRSGWFHGVLGLLGINIFCVAISRWPWRVKHVPFLLAHLGILILLFGSWRTEQFGIDGSLRISEGESASAVELDEASLVIVEGEKVRAISVPWLPPGVPFRGIQVSSLGVFKGTSYHIKIDQFLSHADSKIQFMSADGDRRNPVGDRAPSAGALRLRLAGGPMGISEEIWLWAGGPSWKSVQAGPARFFLDDGMGETTNAKALAVAGSMSGPKMFFKSEKDGGLSYVALSSLGKRVTGRFARDEISGKKILPGWKGNVSVTLEEWIPDALPRSHYQNARIQYGTQAPGSAIHVVVGNEKAANLANPTGVWLGLGDQAVVTAEGGPIQIGYYSKRVMLPFSVRLDRFQIDHDQGTMNPASYASTVTANSQSGQKNAIISMNEPLQVEGYTLYQASYEDASPRPVTSILSVNQDPGRVLKYLGSALIVLGSVLLFAAKQGRKRQGNLNGKV